MANRLPSLPNTSDTRPGTTPLQNVAPIAAVGGCESLGTLGHFHPAIARVFESWAAHTYRGKTIKFIVPLIFAFGISALRVLSFTSAIMKRCMVFMKNYIAVDMYCV